MSDHTLHQLQQRLGSDTVLTDAAAVRKYYRDWHGDVTGEALAVLRPRDTQGVAAAVQACRDLALKIIPQGGNTGLVLGGIPNSSERHVVLSLERLNAVRSIDPDDFTATVEAGCVLSAVKDSVAEQGLLFPLALGAQGSCQIGGNLSTNAGGINVLRYGMTRDLVLGIEVVLPDGTIWDGLSALRKDNRGIDLKQLFIGAEGTLGIITAAVLKLVPMPDQVQTALLGVASLEDAITLYRRARRDCCDLMSAFEFMPPAAFQLALEAKPDLVLPISSDCPYFVLMEISGSGLIDTADLMGRFLEAVLEEGMVMDGVVAASKAQALNLWAFREGMVDGQVLRGKHLRTDISVPLSSLSAFVIEAEAALGVALPDCLAISYGHVGDGNVHLNVLPPRELGLEERRARIKVAKTVINMVLQGYRGSISAEHGIGREKLQDFEAQLDPVQRQLLQSLKNAVDPDGMMNPGCLFPEILS